MKHHKKHNSHYMHHSDREDLMHVEENLHHEMMEKAPFGKHKKTHKRAFF